MIQKLGFLVRQCGIRLVIQNPALCTSISICRREKLTLLSLEGDFLTIRCAFLSSLPTYDGLLAYIKWLVCQLFQATKIIEHRSVREVRSLVPLAGIAQDSDCLPRKCGHQCPERCLARPASGWSSSGSLRWRSEDHVFINTGG